MKNNGLHQWEVKNHTCSSYSVYIYIYIFQFPNIVYIYLKDLLDLLQIYLEYLSMMTPGPAYFLSQSLQYAAPTGIYKPCK